MRRDNVGTGDRRKASQEPLVIAQEWRLGRLGGSKKELVVRHLLKLS